MTLDREQLRREIATLRDKLAGKRRDSLNEENTKMSLIAPMMRALGWDVTDPDEFHCEYRHRPKDLPVDYALKIDRSPCLLIEAKAAGKDIRDPKATTQLLTYTMQVGVPWAVLTNGDDWRIYNCTAQVPVEEKLFREISVGASPVDEVVAALSFLSKPELARRRIDRAWDLHHIDRLVREGLSRILNTASPSPALIKMLVRGSKGRLKAKGVEASLRRAKIAIEIPPGPESDDAAKTTTGTKTRATGKSASKPAAVDGKPKRTGGPRAALDELLRSGALRAPASIIARTRGRDLEATVDKDGAVTFAGSRYDTLSSAASAARASVDPGKWTKKGGPATNGWVFWRLRDGDGRLVTLDEFARRQR